MPLSAESTKTLGLPCPTGKTVLSGGVVVTGPTPAAPVTNVAITTNAPLLDVGWIGRASHIPGATGSFGMTVYAICGFVTR